MAHDHNPEAEKMLDREIKVLDRGFVRLVDYMGGDNRIVQAARVSYGAGTRAVRRNRALIDYLMAHRHTSPFEHVVLEFHCKMPLFVARQWVRHRTARINEISGRYSVMEDEFYCPPEDQVALQSQDNKQGRAQTEVPSELRHKVLDLLREDQERLYGNYQSMLQDGLARELARINLPLSLYTQWYWQIDLHNLLHFLELRMDPHAQWEIRQYATSICKLTRAVAPMAYEAFEEHRLQGVSFSAAEQDALRQVMDGKTHGLSGLAAREFEAKLKSAGLTRIIHENG